MIKEFQGEYRWLSNFAPVNIELGGLIYPSVEHAYMSAKSEDSEWKRFCQDINNSPGAVKKKSRGIQLIAGWDRIKLSVMEYCVRQKFKTQPYKDQLLATGKLHIQEGNLWNDKFWGVCLKTNTGQNHLGKIIMEIREDLFI
jgi:ribA/ribD-fused uncharacterized protein